jgi:hypothetical protein
MKITTNIILMLFLSLVTLQANQAKLQIKQREMGILFVNDLFYDTDGEYTGTKGVYLHLLKHHLRFSYLVDVYTPKKEYRTLSSPPSGERPYAGFGYLYIEQKSTYNHLSFESGLRAGFVGKYSLAKELQHTLHDLANTQRFSGWSSQVQNSFALQLDLKAIYRYTFNNFDFDTGVGADLGNIIVKGDWLAKLSYHTLYDITLNTHLSLSKIRYNRLLSGFDGYEYGVTSTDFVTTYGFGLEKTFRNTIRLELIDHFKTKEYTTQSDVPHHFLMIRLGVRY